MLWAIGCVLYVMMLFFGYLFFRGAAEVDRPTSYPSVMGRTLIYSMKDIIRK